MTRTIFKPNLVEIWFEPRYLLAIKPGRSTRMHSRTATGRPSQPIPLLPRLFLVTGLIIFCLEALEQIGSGLPRLLYPLFFALQPLLSGYQRLRTWALAEPYWALFIAMTALAIGLVVLRYWLLFWHNQVVARLS